MNDTAISSPTIPRKIVNGRIATTAIIIPEVNIGARNPERIFISECPAVILAKRRTPSETARAR